MRDVVIAVEAVLQRRGDSMYFGETVTQKEHALQCAWLAGRERAEDALIVAALLHDVGHLLSGETEDAADRGVDALHEDAGQRWLSQFFGAEVTEPVRLHVDAKRYLCATDRSYYASLSVASRQSLRLQGGPFHLSQLSAFAEQPFAMNAVRLRRWDDRAKTPGLPVPELDHYL